MIVVVVGASALAWLFRSRRREPAIAPAPEPIATPPPAPSAPPPEPRPTSRGRELETAFRDKLTTGTVRDELQAAGRAAAEALLADGDIRTAALVFHDAGLIDEAIQLYLSVLGEPGAAAPLVARTGDHVRAAELYELAGDYARALEQWKATPEHTRDPKTFPERIDRLTTASTKTGRRSTPTSPPPTFDLGAVRALAEQVAKALTDQLTKRELDLARLITAAAAAEPRKTYAIGLEGATKVPLLYDATVRAARSGPPPRTFLVHINQQPCDLGNIEVYYRLGLAHLGAGRYDQAAAAFDRVEETSPGYRDAWKRAKTIRDWEKALGGKLELGTMPTGEARYRLLGELGRGSTAVVYRAKDALLGRDIALKVLSHRLSSDAEVKELFEAAARKSATLSHPNIVAIHDVGTLEGRAYLGMELVDGWTLDVLQQQPQGLSIVESLRAIKQVLDALAYAHVRGVIHRSLEPANIMRTPIGLVKVMDFGLANAIEGAASQSVSVGAPEYRAIEQLRGQPVDQRTDVFAAAVTLYFLLANRFPFQGDDRETPPRRLIDLVQVPSIIDDIVMRSLANDPNARPQSCFEFAHPIGQVLDAVSRISGETTFEPTTARSSGPMNVRFKG